MPNPLEYSGGDPELVAKRVARQSKYAKSPKGHARSRRRMQVGGSGWQYSKSDRAHATRIKKQYGIDYYTVLEGQGGVCAICLRRFVTKRGATDHCHRCPDGDPKGVRAIIHGMENTALGRFEWSPVVARRTAAYLISIAEHLEKEHPE